MRTADFDYHLPPELIAQTPAPERDRSRLLVLHRHSGLTEHRHFRDTLDYLHPGDVMVLNNSRVIPARLRGSNARTGGQFEMLLLEENGVNDWWVLLRPGKRARVGTEIRIASRETRNEQGSTNSEFQIPDSERLSAPGHTGFRNILATVTEINNHGHRRVRFTGTGNIAETLGVLGEVPLPPYIRRHARDSEERITRVPDSARRGGIHETSPHDDCDDRERYQTVFAQPPGSVAAPTAGLHFTNALLDEIRSRGVRVCFVTLHVGPGTFTPVKAETVEAHLMHEERYELNEETAQAVSEAKAAGRRVIAVGTTTVRVLESAFGVPSRRLRDGQPILLPVAGRTRIFIHPPYDFKIVDVLLTNFHLPCSTLLMLVSAFAAPGEIRGRERILSAYAEAIRERYRFFSYGDAMLLL